MLRETYNVKQRDIKHLRDAAAQLLSKPPRTPPGSKGSAGSCSIGDERRRNAISSRKETGGWNDAFLETEEGRNARCCGRVGARDKGETEQHGRNRGAGMAGGSRKKSDSKRIDSGASLLGLHAGDIARHGSDNDRSNGDEARAEASGTLDYEDLRREFIGRGRAESQPARKPARLAYGDRRPFDTREDPQLSRSPATGSAQGTRLNASGSCVSPNGLARWRRGSSRVERAWYTWTREVFLRKRRRFVIYCISCQCHRVLKRRVFKYLKRYSCRRQRREGRVGIQVPAPVSRGATQQSFTQGKRVKVDEKPEAHSPLLEKQPGHFEQARLRFSTQLAHVPSSPQSAQLVFGDRIFGTSDRLALERDLDSTRWQDFQLREGVEDSGTYLEYAE